jgi:2-polyprenyl-3-methyl-5-hydroxy-6-metoxy-1,4-benzoquinol methylase
MMAGRMGVSFTPQGGHRLPSALKYKQRSRTRFDRMAQDYGAHLAGKHAATLYPRVVKVIEGLQPSSVLDVGCGNGNLLVLLNDGARNLAALIYLRK